MLRLKTPRYPLWKSTGPIHWNRSSRILRLFRLVSKLILNLSSVKKFIDAKNMPHLLFHGPPGTGKTSCMIAIAKELYGEKGYKQQTLELNASDDRGINVVRD